MSYSDGHDDLLASSPSSSSSLAVKSIVSVITTACVPPDYTVHNVHLSKSTAATQQLNMPSDQYTNVIIVIIMFISQNDRTTRHKVH